MFVVELFLPLDRGDGSSIPRKEIDAILSDLTERFGGATAFTRAPADGLWKDAGAVEQDRIIVVEVMVDEIDARWWSEYRTRMEKQFQQEQILIRATRCQTL